MKIMYHDIDICTGCPILFFCNLSGWYDNNNDIQVIEIVFSNAKHQ